MPNYKHEEFSPEGRRRKKKKKLKNEKRAKSVEIFHQKGDEAKMEIS